MKVKVLIVVCVIALTINESDQSYISQAKLLLSHLDKCRQGKFDAAGIIQGDFTLFKDKFFWQPARSNIPMVIRSIWHELPDNRARIHAVYERDDHQVWFFIGREIHIFDGPQFKQKLTLHDIGIDASKYSKIKAIFQWPDKDHTYIMSGDNYWRFNGSKVYDGYPQKIESVWGNARSIDTAFSEKNQLFSLSGAYYHEFDPVCLEWKPHGEDISLTFSDCKRTYGKVKPKPYACEKPNFETSSEDARWIMNFFSGKTDASTIFPIQYVQPFIDVPDVCNSSFDAVGTIGKYFPNVFLFKDTFFWSYDTYSKPDGPKEIHGAWPELPANLTHVDAFFETIVDQVWFFIGTKIYIFDGEQLKEISSLRDIGIDETKYSKIDAIFRFPDEDHIFIFSGEDYWRFNVSWVESKVYDGYPRKIESVWKNIGSIDTAFNLRDELYFLEGKQCYQFNNDCMQLIKDTDQKSGSFLYCKSFPKYDYNRKTECEKSDHDTASEDFRSIKDAMVEVREL